MTEHTEVGTIDGAYEERDSRGDLHVQVNGEEILLLMYNSRITSDGTVTRELFREFGFNPDIANEVADLIREAGERAKTNGC